MLRTLLSVPRESRVLVVVSLTVLLQVLVLSAFGLSALKGQDAETERAMREICRTVIDRSILSEVRRRVADEEASITAALAPLRVQEPEKDPVLGRELRRAAEPPSFFRRVFLVTPSGAWFDGDQNMVWPSAGAPGGGTGSDSPDPFEDLRELAVSDPGTAVDAIAARLADAEPATAPEGMLLLGRLQRGLGRRPEAIESYTDITTEYPTSRDAMGLLPALSAARARAAVRIDGRSEGESDGGALVEDLLAIRRLVLQNRFQIEAARADWELVELDRLAGRAAACLSPQEAVEVAAGLARIAEEERDLLETRELFGDDTVASARGILPGGSRAEARSDGPRAAFLVPLSDGAGRATGAAVFVYDMERLRGEVLPAVLRGLPLPAGIVAAVVDGTGKPVVGGTGPMGLKIDQDRLGVIFPGYHAVVYLNDPDLLNRQTAPSRRLHQWIMALSIAGILAAGWFVGRTVTSELKVAKMKSDFLSNVTHELKTPLTSIRMFVETLQQGRVRDEEEQNEYLAVISREAERLGGLIQRVLDLARLEGGKGATGSAGPTDLGRLCRETAEIFRLRLGGTGAEFVEQFDEALPTALLDARAVQEMLLNLLSNSLKYGGSRIRFAAEVKDGHVRFAVEDDGVGIAEDEIGRIFEKFYRANDTLNRGVEGSGLGLSFVREIVRAHGGRVKVKSKPGQGSTFVVTLPLRS